MNPQNGRLRKAHRDNSTTQVPSMHWLFRSNIPRRRRSFLPPDIHKRNFFGMGEILGVITNPAETVRSLTESKRLLDEARQELNENRERAQLRPKHTFSRLPGFFPRKAEMQTVERALEGEPSFTVLFGASSVGKTALLREVLSREQYHVLHFDLRIAGFADLASLYTSLSQQMEQYFEEISTKMPGYESFEKEAWSFKHDRLNVERRVTESSDTRARNIKTSDVARLMELFQSSLLKYWEHQPKGTNDKHGSLNRNARRQATDSTDGTHVDEGHEQNAASAQSQSKMSRWGFRFRRTSKSNDKGNDKRRETTNSPNEESGSHAEKKERMTPVKKMPVIFFDEAHKLPALIHSNETMKCLLDSMLVLTKQDRLCHVIHATSDPFYQTWLRQLNVMQHCKIITIGDCTKTETRHFFRERLLPRVPENLQRNLDFEILYEAFGGKFAHWHDYVTDFVNSNGTIDVKQSSHFLQAHALLNLHIIHSSQSATSNQADGEAAGSNHGAASPSGAVGRVGDNTSNPPTIHPALGPAGFRIYSPFSPTSPSSPYFTSPDFLSSPSDDPATTMLAGYYTADFSAMQLLKVLSRLSQPDTPYLPYFHLCRELGVRAVDGMVKGRVLDLRWTEAVSREGTEEPRVTSSFGAGLGAGYAQRGSNPGVFVTEPAGSSATAVELGPPPPIDEEEDMVPVSEHELGPGMPAHGASPYEDAIEVVGPKLLPTTPIMRFAMREVVQEYEDDQSVSEYASLSDVDEY